MTAESSTIRRPRISRAHYRLLTVAVSSVAGLVVWIVATLAGSRLEVTSPLVGTLAISFPLVIATAIPIAFAAWGVLALLERFTRSARKIWTTIAVIVLLVFVLSVFFLQATTSTKVALGLMHLAVGLPLTIMLPRRARTS